MSDAPPQQQPQRHAPPIIFEQFAGLNTEASRPGIQDEQCSWLDGFFPIGPNNARSIPGVGTTLYTAPGGLTIVFYWFGTIALSFFCIVFLSDGSIVAVNTVDNAVTSLAPPATIEATALVSPLGNGPAVGATQYGDQYIILVAQQTNGYFIWDGTTFFKPGDAFPAETSTVPTGIGGAYAETYQSRVFVLFQTRVTTATNINFTAAGSVVDFATADGGGGFGSANSSLKITYTAMLSTNGYLYLVGDSSISYLSNLVSSGSPITTSFSIIDVDNEVGTPWPYTLQPWNRDLMFANPIGVWQCSGGSARKISDPLDGLYNTVVNFGGNVPSSAKAYIFGKRTYSVLQTVLDLFPATASLYCATPVEMDGTTFLTLPTGAMPNLPATFSTCAFSAWVFLPSDGENEGFWFGNQDDDTTPAVAGLQIGVFNDATSPAGQQIIVTAFDDTNTWVVQAAYAQTTWTGWVWVAISIDTTTQVIQCYVNTGSGDTALTPATIAWNTTNAISNPAGHTWHLDLLPSALMELEDSSGIWLFEDGSGIGWG